MSSLIKTNKSKTIKKNNKTTSNSTKSKLSTIKSQSFNTMFKNLDMETTTQLPSMEEDKTIEESSILQNNIAKIQQEHQPVIRYDNGMIEVDIWASHEHKTLWDSLIHF